MLIRFPVMQGSNDLVNTNDIPTTATRRTRNSSARRHSMTLNGGNFPLTNFVEPLAKVSYGWKLTSLREPTLLSISFNIMIWDLSQWDWSQTSGIPLQARIRPAALTQLQSPRGNNSLLKPVTSAMSIALLWDHWLSSSITCKPSISAFLQRWPKQTEPTDCSWIRNAWLQLTRGLTDQVAQSCCCLCCWFPRVLCDMLLQKNVDLQCFVNLMEFYNWQRWGTT